MANITLSGTLLDPNSGFAARDKIRFTHKTTTGSTLKGSVSTLVIGADGAYSIDLQYGLVLVERRDSTKSQYINLGVVTVNADNPATTLPELLSATVPVSSEELIEFQSILADCVAAQAAAEAAASDAANTVDVALEEAQTSIVARALNVHESAVVASTDTATVLDNVSYIYNTDTHITLSIPILNGTNETIISVAGSSLITSGGSYKLRNLPQETTLVVGEGWGLVAGDMGTPPFTTQNYVDAYNNGLVLTSAIAYANANGYDKVLLQKNTYCFAYATSRAVAVQVYNIDGVTVDLGGSLLKVIYDSENRSPYQPTGNTYALMGYVFSVQNSTNVLLTNGEIQGDKYLRSYTDAGNLERYGEQSYGVLNSYGNYGCVFSHLKVSGFMGDAFTGTTSRFRVFEPADLIFNTGGLSSVGLEVVDDGTGLWRTDYLDLTTGTNQVEDNRLRMGTFYWTMPNEKITVHYYDVSNVWISAEVTRPIGEVNVPPACRYIRLVITDADASGTDNTYINASITTNSGNGTVLEYCEVFNTNRGGVSNFGHETVVRHNYLHDTGGGNASINALDKWGQPTFPDNTRYGVNYEDNMYDNYKIYNNVFTNMYQGVLALGPKWEIYNNEFTDCRVSGVVYYGGYESIIRNNEFIKASVVLGTYKMPEVQKSLTIRDNKFKAGSIIVALDDADRASRQSMRIEGNEMIDGVLDADYDAIIIGNRLTESGTTATRAGLINNIHTKLAHYGPNYVDYTKTQSGSYVQVKESSATPYSGGLGITGVNGADIRMGAYSSSQMIEYFDGWVLQDCNLLKSATQAIEQEDRVAVGGTEDDLQFKMYSNFKVDEDSKVIIAPVLYSNKKALPSLNIIKSCLGKIYFASVLREGDGVGTNKTHKVVFNDCMIDVTDESNQIISALSYCDYPTALRILDVEYKDCTFINRNPTSINIKLAAGDGAHCTITSTATNCTFINCTNNDGITVIS